MHMLVLIDESGDPGFKLNKGSTPYFVCGMIVFRDFKEAEDCNKAILQLKNDLQINYEFKFNKTKADNKDHFFNAIASCEYEVWALVVDKKKIYSQTLKRSDDKFYNFFIKNLLASGADLKDAIVKIDGSGDREFKRKMQKYLTAQLKHKAIKSFKFINSEKDNLIQLADMVTGAIARSYKKDRSDNDRWRKMIEDKIKNCWDFE